MDGVLPLSDFARQWTQMREEALAAFLGAELEVLEVDGRPSAARAMPSE